MTAHNFNPTILREYDIRGVVGQNLDEKDAYALGRAFGTYVHRHGGRTVCVGYDGRVTSVALSEALIRGLDESGCEITNVGLGPSPMLYFAVKDRGADAGVMVTGSHNPGDYNGFKMQLKKGPVFGEQIQEIGRIAARGEFHTAPGRIQSADVKDAYVARLLKDLTNTQDVKIAWDAGNGAAGEILRRLTAQLPGKHILLFDEIDGTFPNHHPDPTVDKNLKDLQDAVRAHKCDFGIAFDGDGDRIGVVDETGTVIRCDMLMTVYARGVLETHPGAPIIGDVKCSQAMFDAIDSMGGRGVMWKTGHSLIKSKMAELNAPLAGELSGHIFFADKYYGFDDALYCAIRLINEAEREDTLSALLPVSSKFYNTPELRFEVDEAEKFALVPRVIESVRTAHPSIAINDIDGIRATTPDGWWLLRASNTQNVLVARAESSSEAGLARLQDMLAAEIEKLGYEIGAGDSH